MAAQGRTQEGIAQIQDGLANTRVIGWTELYRPYGLSLLAEACGEAGRFVEGLSALTEALTIADRNENQPLLRGGDASTQRRVAAQAR